MHHHQSRHAQSPATLSHSSCSYLKLQSPPILIIHSVYLFSEMFSLRGHYSSTGTIPQLYPNRLLWCVIVIQGRHTDNTLCKTLDGNEAAIDSSSIIDVSYITLWFSQPQLYAQIPLKVHFNYWSEIQLNNYHLSDCAVLLVWPLILHKVYHFNHLL